MSLLVEPPTPSEDEPRTLAADVASIAGYVLAVSYPILALSTGVRAIYQLAFKPDVASYVGPWLSLLAAGCYLVASFGFAYRRPWTWYLSFSVLTFETAMTLLVGTLSYVYPETIGGTAWRHFGADYGFFPLFQPLLGLLWLAWPVTLRAYSVHPRWLPKRIYGEAP